MTYDYDLIVIGGGAGGMTAAKTAHGLGKKVLILEKKQLGGECTWTGCIPSKTLIHIAHIAHSAASLQQYGLSVIHPIELQTTNVMKHVRKAVQEVYATHTPEKLRQEGIGVLFGAPEFINKHSVQVDDKIITFKKCIIATGSRPFVPTIDGLDQISYYTNETIFDIDELPHSLLILGGGPIGVEMASALNYLGTKVTIIEKKDRLLTHDDAELVELLTRHLKHEGIRIVTNHKATKISKREDGTVQTTCISSTGKQQEIIANAILVAVGRTPNIAGLYLEKAGIKTDKRGIIVNKQLRTTARTIFAVGDVVGPYRFSHMAWHQAVAAARNAFVPFFKKKMTYENVLWVTFTSPELATAGLTEQQARKKHGKNIRVYKKQYRTLDRARCDDVNEGLIKIICNKKGAIIGAHILGKNAGEIIHELQLAKTRNIPLVDLHTVIHAYPTYSELIWHLAKQAYIDQLQSNIFLRLLKKLF